MSQYLKKTKQKLFKPDTDMVIDTVLVNLLKCTVVVWTDQSIVLFRAFDKSVNVLFSIVARPLTNIVIWSS